MTLFLPFLLIFLPSMLGWEIVENINKSELVPGVPQPRFTVQWNGDNMNLEEKLQAFHQWEVQSTAAIPSENRADSQAFRNSMFCYPGPRLLAPAPESELHVFPTCDDFREFYAKTVNETNEFFELVPNKGILEESLKNGTDSPISLLNAQRQRIRTLLGFMSNQRSPILASLLEKVEDFFIYADQYRPDDIQTDKNGTEQNRTGGAGLDLSQFPILDILRNSSVERRNAVKETVEKSINRTFSDEEWKKLMFLVRNEWTTLHSRDNSTSLQQLKQIVTGNGSNPQAFTALQTLLENGTLFSTVRNTLEQQSLNTRERISSVISSFLQTLQSLRSNNLDANSAGTGGMGQLFGLLKG